MFLDASILIMNNPLCILNNADFNVVYVPVKDEPVDELYNCQCGHFGQYPGLEPLKGPCVVPSYHELAAQLREQGLYALSALSQFKWSWTISFLVRPHGCLQFRVARIGQVQLPLRREIPLVPKHGAVGHLAFDVLEVMDIVHRCGTNVQTMENTGL